MGDFTTISTDWLGDESPLLLRYMTTNPATRETLAGEDEGFDLHTHAQAIGQYKNHYYVGFSKESGGR